MKELFRLKNKIKYPKTNKKKIRYKYLTKKIISADSKN